MRTLPAATALAVLFSSAALAVAPTASADGARILPVKSAGDIVVDGVHQRVFISSPYDGKVVATDYSGTVVGTVASLPGVEGLQLSADSTTVYAAVPGADTIAAIDTASVKESARYATGEGTDPAHLALAGGKLWFGYGNADHGDIGSLDLSGAEPVVTLAQDTATDHQGAPRLAATPGAPNLLAAASPEYYGSWLTVYDVSTGTATRTAAHDGSSSNLGSTADLAFTPDGSRLITANPGDEHTVWQTSDLTEVGAYKTEYHPEAVAIAGDGTVAAGSSGTYDPGLFVFKPGATTPVRSYEFPSTGSSSGNDALGDENLAWEPGPGAGRLFGVTHNIDSEYTLRVFTDPTKSKPALTVTAPATATRAKALTVSGTLTATVPLPAGTPLTVTRTDLESPKGKSLGTKTLGAGGKFSFKDTPPAGGKVTYKVTYAGDAEHTAASASAKVEVSRATPTLSLDKNRKTYAYGADVKFTAHLGKTHKNRKVEIWADPYGSDKPNRLVKSGTVNSKGDLSVTVDLRRDTKLSAKFTGDARYKAKTVTNTVYTKVAISSSISGHYKTKSVWGQKYHYVRKSKDPVLKTSMTYYEGRKHRLQLEYRYDGRWYDAGSEYFPLGTAGRSDVTLTGTPTTDIRFRFRSEYHDTTSGDNVNTTTYGPWKYFIFTK
ncbi:MULTISPECIES: YncE family protein [Streptomyces]|uniref:Ig-like domain repeat protein n=1 Tax=Streptomyces griseiscabiei TaxID=2993540 RepID=A0ABU4LJ31_9ACTN|nr:MULTISPECIES: Ig-like domain repeat protein [Streptomyces]MDX2915809.1 Ig-like domain repeat protein [Streptomyces griseiscabiei]